MKWDGKTKNANGQIVFLVVSVLISCLFSETLDAQMIPHLQKHGDSIQLMVNDEPWLVLGGELHNSSASTLEYMQTIWKHLVDLNLNTVLATVTWDQFEPEEGHYDYRLVDGLIHDARAYHLKLVFLWFASWKNGVSSYTPAWVKQNPERFPRVLRENGELTGVLTPLSQESCTADAKAFSALMRHIREVDADEKTVLMMQVENEVGLLGDSRDRSPAADDAFHSPVPPSLMDELSKWKENLIPELKAVWERNGAKTSGNWAEIFGDTLEGDEIFMAWHLAKYIGQVAAAGKKEYPLPMYVNAWLVQNEGQEPGRYPSGGPVSKMMDIWRAAAPEIDLFAPDIYLPTFKEVCAHYTRSGNPLFIPEVASGPEAAGKAFYAIAQHNAICFAPFGIEDLTVDHPLVPVYKMLTSLMPLILTNQGSGQMTGIYQDGDDRQEIDLGNYRLYVEFAQPGDDAVREKGYGLILALQPDEFLIAGRGFRVHPGSRPGGLPHTEILSVEEGYYQDGQWHLLRQLNGDETAAHWQVQIPVNSSDRHFQKTFGNLDVLRMKVHSFE